MPRRSRREIFGKRAQIERLRCEEELNELERELHHEWRQCQADDERGAQAEDIATDDGPTPDEAPNE